MVHRTFDYVEEEIAMDQSVEILEVEAPHEEGQVVELSYEELVAVAGGYGDSGHL